MYLKNVFIYFLIGYENPNFRFIPKSLNEFYTNI